MSLVIYEITPDQMRMLIDKHLPRLSEIDIITLISSGEISRPLLCALYNTTLLSFMGFVPQTLLSSTAHMWCYALPAVDNHKLSFARHSRRLVSAMFPTYPTIIGYSFTSSAKAWMSWVGAEFNGDAFTLRSPT